MVQIGCVLLAAGVSQRFGPPDKLLVGDYPLAERAMRKLAEIPFCRKIAVVSKNETACMAERYGLKPVWNHEPERGLYTSISIGAAAMGDGNPCMFTVGDQPCLTENTMLGMMRGYEQGTILRAQWRDIAGNPVIFPEALIGELEKLDWGMTGKTVIQRHLKQVRYYAVENGCELKDVDTPEALFALLGISSFRIAGENKRAIEAVLAGREYRQEKKGFLVGPGGREFVYHTDRQSVADCIFLLNRFLNWKEQKEK